MGAIEDGPEVWPGYGQKCCRCNVPVHCNVVHHREGRPLCLGCYLSPPPGRPPEQFTLVHSSERRPPMGVGDEVEKRGGDYSYEGVVRAVVVKASGAVRYVVEDARGLLSTFSEGQLALRKRAEKEKVTG